MMEDGTITLVGATTENPSFELNAALLSRASVLTFRRSTMRRLEALLARAEAHEGRASCRSTDDARAALIAHGRRRRPRRSRWPRSVAGAPPARKASASTARRWPRDGAAPRAALRQGAGRPLQPDQRAAQIGARLGPRRRALLARRMLDAGEIPLYLARRLVRMAVEDIGLADPQALVQAHRREGRLRFLGSPEGELALAQATIYLAVAPKSNAALCRLQGEARGRGDGSLLPPKHILNAPTKLMKQEGYGEATPTTTTKPRRSPARTTSPRRWSGSCSTRRWLCRLRR
jgi:putative ATPase